MGTAAVNSKYLESAKAYAIGLLEQVTNKAEEIRYIECKDLCTAVGNLFKAYAEQCQKDACPLVSSIGYFSQNIHESIAYGFVGVDCSDKTKVTNVLSLVVDSLECEIKRLGLLDRLEACNSTYCKKSPLKNTEDKNTASFDSKSSVDSKPSTSDESSSNPPPQPKEYTFKPLLHLPKSGSISFVSSLNPLIQELPKVLLGKDFGKIGNWLPFLTLGQESGQQSATKSKVGRSIGRDYLEDIKELDKKFSFSDSNEVGEKLSELLDNEKLLIYMCLARVANSKLKPSYLGRVQKDINLHIMTDSTLEKFELSQAHSNPDKSDSYRTRFVNSWQGEPSERRQYHQPVFDVVTQKVRDHLLPAGDQNESEKDRVKKFLDTAYQKIVKDPSKPTPQECEQLFKVALKCYAVGIFPDTQYSIQQKGKVEAFDAPRGASLLVELLKAQKFLEKKQVFVPDSKGVLHPLMDDKTGEPSDRPPNLDECKAFVKALEEGFGVPFALDVSDPKTAVKFEPEHVLLRMQVKEDLLFPLHTRHEIDLRHKDNADIKSFLAFISERVHRGFEVFNITANKKAKAEAGSSSNPQARVDQYFETLLRPMIRSITDGSESGDVKQRLTTMSALFGKLKTTEPQKPIILNQDCLWQMLTKAPVTWGHLIDWVNDSSGSNSEDFQKKLEALSQIVVTAGNKEVALRDLSELGTSDEVNKYADQELAVITLMDEVLDGFENSLTSSEKALHVLGNSVDNESHTGSQYNSDFGSGGSSPDSLERQMMTLGARKALVRLNMDNHFDVLFNSLKPHPTEKQKDQLKSVVLENFNQEKFDNIDDVQGNVAQFVYHFLYVMRNGQQELAAYNIDDLLAHVKQKPEDPRIIEETRKDVALSSGSGSSSPKTPPRPDSPQIPSEAKIQEFDEGEPFSSEDVKLVTNLLFGKG